MDIYSMTGEMYCIAANVFTHIVGFALGIVAAAILIAIAGLILLAAYATISAAFDRITRHMAKRMFRNGKQPRTKAGRIILASLKNNGSV